MRTASPPIECRSVLALGGARSGKSRYALALAVSAVYVLTIPPSPIGHSGYFTHKQELGLLGVVGIIVSSHELLQRGWRRLAGLIAMGLGFWLVFESQSKSPMRFRVPREMGSAFWERKRRRGRPARLTSRCGPRPFTKAATQILRGGTLGRPGHPQYLRGRQHEQRSWGSNG